STAVRSDEHDHNDDEQHYDHDGSAAQNDDHHQAGTRHHDDRPSFGYLSMAVATFARSRRRSELSLGLLVIVFTVGGYILVALANGPKLPPNVAILLAWVFGLYLVAHLAVRRFAPAADGTLLPIAAMLNGLGF